MKGETVPTSFLDDYISLELFPKKLSADGKSIGHFVITTNDPKKRSIDGSYPIQVAMRNAAIITKSNNPAAQSENDSQHRKVSFLTTDNELRINYIPDKNTEESDLFISTPWGDIEQRIKFTTGLKHSISETMECMIYAFIIAIIFRYLLFSAFFIPSQSMKNTLDIGDRIIASKIVYTLRDPRNQEVVIFNTFSPKERMAKFHLESSIHFDPIRNLREPDYYKDAGELVKAIVDADFRDRVEIRDDAFYVNNLCMGFPQNSDDPGKLEIDGKFFAYGEIINDDITLPDQFLGSLYIIGNHLMLGDNRIDLGQVDVYYPLGNPGYVMYKSQMPRNLILDAIKAGFFKLIGRKPQLLVGENQVIGDLILKGRDWTIFGQPLDLNMNRRPLRFSLPYQGRNQNRIELGRMYVENGVIVLKNGDKILKRFGQPILRDDIALINGQLLGYVRKTDDGFTINSLPLTTLWETRDFIKRCIAVPGDELKIENGKVFINGEPLNEPYLDDENMRYDDFGPITIPEGRYFMMGDNRNNSKDSRYLGPVLRENIRGKAMLVFYPFNRVKSVR
ncbi:signal peptidase I [bacterium]|nr:signal peptidase I [bacterium]